MIFNLFVAILLEEFEGDDDEDEDEDDGGDDGNSGENNEGGKKQLERQISLSKRTSSAQLLVVPQKDPSGKIVMKKYKVSPVDGSNEEVGDDENDVDEEPDKMIMSGTAL